MIVDIKPKPPGASGTESSAPVRKTSAQQHAAKLAAAEVQRRLPERALEAPAQQHQAHQNKLDRYAPSHLSMALEKTAALAKKSEGVNFEKVIQARTWLNSTRYHISFDRLADKMMDDEQFGEDESLG